MAKSKYKFWTIAAILVLLASGRAVWAAGKTMTMPKAKSSSTVSSKSTPTPITKGDRRYDVTGLHKGSVEAQTLHLYTKVDEMRADPLLRELLKSAASTDSPYGTQGFDQRAAESNLDIAENLAASFIRQDKFDVDQLNGIEAKECIVLGPKSHENIVDLTQGNALFAPSKDIIVLTNLGEISIGAGSFVCVLKPEPGVVAVYDLHDGKDKKVTVKTKGETLSLVPGKQIILSNRSEKELEFEKINPARRIAYRKLESRNLPSGTKIYAGEFSIPSAMLYVKPLRTLLLSDKKEDRKLADCLLKNFVIMEDVFGSEGEPYKMPRPFELTRISANVK